MINLLMNPFIPAPLGMNQLQDEQAANRPWLTTNSVARAPSAGDASKGDHLLPPSQVSNREGQLLSSASSRIVQNTSSEFGLLPMDIVCSRNNAMQKNPGNHKYNDLILEHREAYQSSTQKDEKSALTRKVLQRVQHFGGRFVKYDEKLQRWVEIDEDARREKVSHALRSTLDPKKRRRRSRTSPSPSGSGTKDSAAKSPSSRGGRKTMSDADFLQTDPAFRRIYERQQAIFQQMRLREGSGGEETPSVAAGQVGNNNSGYVVNTNARGAEEEEEQVGLRDDPLEQLPLHHFLMAPFHPHDDDSSLSDIFDE